MGIHVGSAEVTFTDSDGMDYSVAMGSVGYYKITLPFKTTVMETNNFIPFLLRTLFLGSLVPFSKAR